MTNTEIRIVSGRKVRIDYVYPPIPWRNFDWVATFDGDEPNDDGQMLCGYGATKDAALNDLLELAEDAP